MRVEFTRNELGHKTFDGLLRELYINENNFFRIDSIVLYVEDFIALNIEGEELPF